MRRARLPLRIEVLAHQAMRAAQYRQITAAASEKVRLGENPTFDYAVADSQFPCDHFVFQAARIVIQRFVRIERLAHLAKGPAVDKADH